MAINENTAPLETYDMVIVGGGPGGLTAGLYAARDKQDVIMLEKLSPGGQVLSTDWVENYSGFPDGIGGFDLMERMQKQAEKFGLKILSHEVSGVDFTGAEKILKLNTGSIAARSVILATGAQPRKLGIEGEGLLTGKGVSYCGTCDGPFYRDAVVAVIGGGDTAALNAEKYLEALHH